MHAKQPFITIPSVWIPLFMSFFAFLLVVSYVAFVGFSSQPQGDEGAPARVFQLLMAGQLPIIAFFLIKWFPKKPRQTILFFLLQVFAAVLAIIPVIYLEM